MEPVPVKPDSAAPAGVDYDMWLGPAKKRPFNPNRFHFNFRWFWDYAGGLMTDWGVHEIDIALYAMNAKAPKSVMASVGNWLIRRRVGDPDTLQTVYEYEGFTCFGNTPRVSTEVTTASPKGLHLSETTVRLYCTVVAGRCTPKPKPKTD
jgi:predicted dehydrogenase